MNDLRAEQALRVLDAIEAALRSGSRFRLSINPDTGALYVSHYRGSLSVHGGVHTGGSLLDALAQCSQALVSSGEPWGEPGLLDAESDVDAFDRATGGQS